MHSIALWTFEHDETAKKMWAKGYTAAQIGAQLGRTRNSVIGRLHRLKVPKRDNELMDKRARRYPDQSKLEKRMRVAFQRMRFASKPTRQIVFALHPHNNPHREKNVGLLAAEFGQCREIVNDRGDDGLAVFCGEQTATGSFCPYHSYMNFNDTRPVASAYIQRRATCEAPSSEWDNEFSPAKDETIATPQPGAGGGAAESRGQIAISNALNSSGIAA